VVTFPKAGKFVLRSGLQPGVTLTVNVKKGVRSTKKADAARTARELRANAKLAKRLLRSKGPDGNLVRAGNDAKGVATIAFFPATKTVKVGDTVTFAMSSHSIETHNVAFGPKPYLDEQAKKFFGPVFEPFVTFRSEAPGTPITFDGANHGNGYVNTGVMDANPNTPLPSSEQVTFTKPGTYAYYCAVHGNDMSGEIVVK
jgi:plastocyanin